VAVLEHQPEEEGEPDDGHADADGVAEEARRLLAAAGFEDTDPEIDVDPDDPLPSPDVHLQIAQPRPKATPEQARLTLQAQLDEWRRDGRLEFAPRDLYDLRLRVARERSWLHAQLDRLMAEGQIARVDEGRYRFRRGGVG
jgi:hypothetical protein